MEKGEEQIPPWLKPLLQATFFIDCQTHRNSNNNQCNYYCLECTRNSLCVYCSNDHSKHHVIQIRRSSLSDCVKVQDIAEYINVHAIQTYVANSGLIVFLNARSYRARPHGVINTCDICHRSLPTANFKFCSLSCKRDAIYRGFPQQTFTLEQKLNACELDESIRVDQLLAPESQKNKMRKLDILVSKSFIATTSCAKEIPNRISPTTPPMFNHMNSRKRKGIPRRAPLT